MRAFLNVDDGQLAQESLHSDEGLFALYVFTDGSARKMSRKETCAGWCFTAMKSCQNRDENPMKEAFGGEHCLGAIRATNHTARL